MDSELLEDIMITVIVLAASLWMSLAILWLRDQIQDRRKARRKTARQSAQVGMPRESTSASDTLFGKTRILPKPRETAEQRALQAEERAAAAEERARRAEARAARAKVKAKEASEQAARADNRVVRLEGLIKAMALELGRCEGRLQAAGLPVTPKSFSHHLLSERPQERPPHAEDPDNRQPARTS